MAVSTARDRFRTGPGAERLVRAMGPITLLYHRRSGITHMVGEAVPQILDAIDAIGPASADAVALWLGARFDLHGDDDSGSDDDMMAVIAARLEELALLGLITRVPA